MKKKELYRLPTLGRDVVRRALVRAGGIYLAVLAAVAWILTQRLAHHLGYPEALGEPWLVLDDPPTALLRYAGLALAVAVGPALLLPRFRRAAPLLTVAALLLTALAHGPLYAPTGLLLWHRRFRHLPELAALTGPPIRLLTTVAVAGGVVACVHLLTVLAKLRDLGDLHGSAHWATSREVEAAGLLGHRGLLLGLWRHRGRLRYLRHHGPEHVFVFAPTRSGKGVGLVLPNLLSWPHSVLVHDIKGENWALSAGWRRRELGSLCLRFDPTDADGTAARYNPLAEIRRGPHEVRDAQNVADILVDPNGERQRSHWDRTAHALLVGVILHVLYAEPDRTLRGCVHLLTHPERPVEETLESMLTTVHDPDREMAWVDPVSGLPTRTHPLVAGAARALLDKADRERSGVLSTALAHLDLYRDPIVARNTEASDFRLRDLMNHRKPLSLYLTVPSSDLSRTRPLMRMLLNQALRRLTEQMTFENGRPVPHYRYPLLLMLDEFPALGRLAFFQDSLAFLGGYGIRAFLIAQDLSQIFSAYGRDESITGNCHLRVAFAPNKPETADLLSRMAGEMTVHHQQRSLRSDRSRFFMSHESLAYQQTRRRLLTPDEAMRLPADDALLFAAGHPPVRATKIRYFEDRLLGARARIPAPVLSDVVEPSDDTDASGGTDH